MTTYGWLILALWLALIAYWALSAHAVARTLHRWMWWREIAVRLGFFALVATALQVGAMGGALSNARVYALGTGTVAGVIGTVLCAAGIGLAVLARAALGQSWAGPKAPGAAPELITTGPYAYVRHPIYGGMLLGMLGSSIGQSVLWLLPLMVYGPQFIHSAQREEGLLLEQYPERYRAYMKQTKMLLPFVL